MMFMVIPRKFMTMKDEMTEIGRVRPVITVERQELRNRKTMKMVSRPPRTRVTFTSATDSRIIVELSRTISIWVPAGISARSLSTAFMTLSTTSTVLALDCLRTVHSHGRDAVDQRQ